MHLKSKLRTCLEKLCPPLSTLWPAPPVIDDPQLFGWISMTLDGDAAFIDADANETASRHPEHVSKGEP